MKEDNIKRFYTPFSLDLECPCPQFGAIGRSWNFQEMRLGGRLLGHWEYALKRDCDFLVSSWSLFSFLVRGEWFCSDICSYHDKPPQAQSLEVNGSWTQTFLTVSQNKLSLSFFVSWWFLRSFYSNGKLTQYCSMTFYGYFQKGKTMGTKTSVVSSCHMWR